MRQLHTARFLLATLALLRVAGAAGAEPLYIAPSPLATRDLPLLTDLPSPRGQDFGAHLDYWHDSLFVYVQDLIEQQDVRFATPDADRIAIPVSPFRIGLDSDFISQPGGKAIAPHLDVDLALQMPNLERRLQLFITSDTLAEAPTALGRSSNELRAGLRLTPLRFFDFDIGIQADLPPYAYTSLRWQRTYTFVGWQVQPFMKLYLESQRGLGLASGFSVDRWIDNWVARFATYANWRKDTADTEWTQAVTLARAQEMLRMGRYSDVVGGRDVARGFGVQLLASGTHVTGTQRYEADIFYKHPTRTHWLYWHVTPFVRWERQFRWHPDPGINVGVDALLWDVSSR